MEQKYKVALIFLIFSAVLMYALFKNQSINAYRVDEYFPLNSGDTYVYSQHEGPESGEVTVRVANVRKTAQGKEFDFVWSGLYNDRVMSLVLDSRGISFQKNNASTGVIRTFSSKSPVMIPAILQRNPNYYEDVTERVEGGRDEKRETTISFVGFENVQVPAGTFPCLHFLTVVTNKDLKGNGRHRHCYDFWITRHIGLVKQMHCFTRLDNFQYVAPGKKTLMNRYDSFFLEVLELRRAIIAGQELRAD